MLRLRVEASVLEVCGLLEEMLSLQHMWSLDHVFVFVYLEVCGLSEEPLPLKEI